jgi:hypothetical protein
VTFQNLFSHSAEWLDLNPLLFDAKTLLLPPSYISFFEKPQLERHSEGLHKEWDGPKLQVIHYFTVNLSRGSHISSEPFLPLFP